MLMLDPVFDDEEQLERFAAELAPRLSDAIVRSDDQRARHSRDLQRRRPSSSTGISPRARGRAPLPLPRPVADIRGGRCVDVTAPRRRLAGLGIEIENRVLLALPDGPAFVATFWGAARLGAVAVPVDPPAHAGRVRIHPGRQPGQGRRGGSGARAPALLAARARCPWLRAVVVADGPSRRARSLSMRLLARAASHLPAARTFREDLVYWGYTSGSTGRPKAAVHSHTDLVAAADLVGVGIFGLGPDDLVFSVSKLFFAFGLGNSLYFPAAVGGGRAARPRAHRRRACLHGHRGRAPDRVLRRSHALRAHARGPGRQTALRPLVAALCRLVGRGAAADALRWWRTHFAMELLEVVGSTEALHDFIANRPGQTRRGSGVAWSRGSRFGSWTRREHPCPRGRSATSWCEARPRRPTTGIASSARARPCSASGCGRATCSGRMPTASSTLRAAPTTCSRWRACGCRRPRSRRTSWPPRRAEAGVIGHRTRTGSPGPTPSSRSRRTRPVPRPVRRAPRSCAAAPRATRHRRWIDFVDELPKTPTGKMQRFRLRAGSAERRCASSSKTCRRRTAIGAARP